MSASSFTKTLYIDLLPLPPWSCLSELSEVLPPGCSPHFAPNKTKLTTVKLCIYLVDTPLDLQCSGAAEGPTGPVAPEMCHLIRIKTQNGFQ